MAASATRQQPIMLDFRDGNRPVVVAPEDQDRFIMTCEMAAQACRQAMKMQEWREQFYALLGAVHRWAQRNSPRIDACYVSPIEGGLAVFIVPKAQRYDFELSESLTDLDISLASDYPLCRCDVMQIPGADPNRLRTFLDPQKAILIHGQPIRPHSQVEAQ